jgi:hypothetical protein
MLVSKAWVPVSHDAPRDAHLVAEFTVLSVAPHKYKSLCKIDCLANVALFYIVRVAFSLFFRHLAPVGVSQRRISTVIWILMLQVQASPLLLFFPDASNPHAHNSLHKTAVGGKKGTSVISCRSTPVVCDQGSARFEDIFVVVVVLIFLMLKTVYPTHKSIHSTMVVLVAECSVNSILGNKRLGSRLRRGTAIRETPKRHSDKAV